MGKSAAINQKLYVTVVGEHTIFVFVSVIFFFVYFDFVFDSV